AAAAAPLVHSMDAAPATAAPPTAPATAAAAASATAASPVLTTATVAQCSRVQRSAAECIFRNTHSRWLHPSRVKAAACILTGEGTEIVLAKVVALAARQFAAAASGVGAAACDDWDAMGVDEPQQLSVDIAHAQIWGLAKNLIADVKSLPPQEAVELMKYLSQVARDRVAGNVHDPLIRQRRTQKVLGKRARSSTAGPSKKKKT
ncbi:hypothetical protein JKP88DRAFT_231274, partial [Tribonema minus]